MHLDPTIILILAATLVTGLLAGISFDKAIVQLPARRRMGIRGFAAFSRANDLGNGLVLYPVLGILSAALTLLAALSALLHAASLARVWPLYVAALLAILHSITTARAAPLMLNLRVTMDDESILTATLDRFARWHTVRAILQVLHFAVLIWSLVAYIAMA